MWRRSGRNVLGLALAVSLVLVASAVWAAVPRPPEQAKLTASDAAAADIFGRDVAISGDTVVIGAPWDDDFGRISGAAYVFVRSGSTWAEQAKLTPSDGAAEDQFGRSVAIDGDTIVIGAGGDDDAGSNSGAAYVFVRSGSTWSEQAKLTASDPEATDGFGISVAVSEETAVIGSFSDNHSGIISAGSAYVFVRSGITWAEQSKLTASDAEAGDLMGFNVAISGDSVVASSLDDDAGFNAGAAYVFVRSGSAWAEQAKLIASDADVEDGDLAVAISGDTVVVGSERHDNAAGQNSGAAYVFTRTGVTWAEEAKLTPADASIFDGFGRSVGIEGDTIVVGTVGDDHAGNASGSAYVFSRAGTTWTEESKLTASDAAASDFFGASVSISGDTAAVGAYLDDHSGLESPGAAYIFVPNLPPTADAGADQNVEWATGGVQATLDGTGSSDPNGDTLTYTWTGAFNEGGGTATGESPTVTFAAPGSYDVNLEVDDGNGATDTDIVTINVVNEAPTCEVATPSVGRLWPPNHKYHDISVVGVTDPNGDAFTLTIDSIFQDEAVDAPGSGNTAPDGGVGTSTAQVRAERAGGGNGRVYHIGFSAVDEFDGACSGEVLIGVPHNKKAVPVDDGALYDSTLAP